MPRRNSNAGSKDGFESMSGAKIKALLESLRWDWKRRTEQSAGPEPADRERW